MSPLQLRAFSAGFQIPRKWLVSFANLQSAVSTAASIVAAANVATAALNSGSQEPFNHGTKRKSMTRRPRGPRKHSIGKNDKSLLYYKRNIHGKWMNANEWILGMHAVIVDSTLHCSQGESSPMRNTTVDRGWLVMVSHSRELSYLLSQSVGFSVATHVHRVSQCERDIFLNTTLLNFYWNIYVQHNMQLRAPRCTNLARCWLVLIRASHNPGDIVPNLNRP